MERRVVITGLGAITPIGNNVGQTWNGIKEKKCGIIVTVDDIKILHFTTNFKTWSITSVIAAIKNTFFVFSILSPN